MVVKMSVRASKPLSATTTVFIFIYWPNYISIILM